MSNTLAEIKSGKKTGLVVPHRTTYDPGEDRDIKTILPAVGGDELEILLLAVNQYIDYYLVGSAASSLSWRGVGQ